MAQLLPWIGAGLLQAAPTPPAPSAAAPTSASTPLRLVPIEPGVADVSPLQDSTRVPRVDLRQPLAFDRVYRVESDLRLLGRGFTSTQTPLLARVSGSIVALFPQSLYQPSRNGPRAIVPPGTIFLIGEPTEIVSPDASRETLPGSNPRPTMHRADLSARASAGTSEPTPRPATSAREPARPDREGPGRSGSQARTSEPEADASIFSSERLRQQRLAELLAPRTARPDRARSGPVPASPVPAGADSPAPSRP